MLAQQRLIKMLEKQRNAEAEKVKLLQAEVQELRMAHQQVRVPRDRSVVHVVCLL